MKMKNCLQLTGKQLRCAAMPLGGIGTGSIALGGDGLLKQWQILNNVRHIAFIPNSFFGIWTREITKSSKPSVSRALICSRVHNDPHFVPAETVNDHKIGIAAKEMFEIVPGVDNVQFNGEYPVAFLKFIDSALPVDVSLTAFNPFIPLNPKDSALPLIVFEFDIMNPTHEPYEVGIVGSLLNFLGWDGLKTFKGTDSILFAGNKNIHKTLGTWNVLHMKSSTLLKTDRRYGDLTLAIDQSDAMMTPQWEDLNRFWRHFSLNGELPRSDSEDISPVGKTWTGSLGSRKVIQPGESKKVTFVLVWNFPNRVVDWIIDKAQIPDNHTEFWIGNRYNEWFKNSLDVLKYLQENLEVLRFKTEQFHKIMFSTTLPSEVITSITAPISTIRSPSCFWIKDGSFHGFEGCHGASTSKSSGGCCPLDCTHVWNYEFSLAHLFPSLERTMRETEFKMQHESGYLPHRAVVPLYLPQLLKEGKWDLIGPAIDGMFGTILKIYRDFLITGDRHFLKKSWPLIEKLINYVFENYDHELKGVIYSEQPNTYDCTLYGINTFIGTLYLTALLACEQIAKLLELRGMPKKFRKMYDSGKLILDEECWNEEYFIQRYDKEHILKHQYGIGCHSDQLIGQWWAFQLGFGYILPPEHVNKAIESIIRYNFKETLEGIEQFRIFASESDPGVLNCTWPYGEEPDVPILYNNEVWTGIEYEIASLCIYTGRFPDALKVINAVRKRYDGTRRNPWNEVECGDHYVRAMSSWTLLQALMGLTYSMELKQLTFEPRFKGNEIKTLFITGNCWGQIIRRVLKDACSFSLSVSYGEVEIKCIQLEQKIKWSPKRCSISLKEGISGEERAKASSFSKKASKIEINILETLILKEGYQLFVEIT
jgi:non-lysosomal glucosylceramidase